MDIGELARHRRVASSRYGESAPGSGVRLARARGKRRH
jgi:hypothetical protein